MIVIRKVYLRPIRSPIRPKKRAPKGRTGEAHAHEGQTGKKKAAVSFPDEEEELAEEHGQRRVDVKIVPFENGAEGGREDDEPVFAVERGGVGHRGFGGSRFRSAPNRRWHA